MNINDNEQWLSEGKCHLCRRANYCKKDCTAYKKRKNQIIKQAYNDVLEKEYPELAQIAQMLKIN